MLYQQAIAFICENDNVICEIQFLLRMGQSALQIVPFF